jgi:hypothetical protein
MPLQVLEVEQRQRDAGPPPFGVEVGAVRERARRPGRTARPIQARLQGLVGQGLHLGPVEAGRAGAKHRRPDGAHADSEAGRHLAVAPPQEPFLSKDVAGVSHG